MQKRLYKLVPKYIPEPISYKNGIMKSRKYGVSLKQWLKTHKYRPQIAQNVRLILNKIRRKYPGFRHMDLHIGNVLVYKGKIMLIDFGLSRLNAKGVSQNRDMITFFNSLRRFLKKKKCSYSCSAASIAKRIMHI